jgi:hypothetical protein
MALLLTCVEVLMFVYHDLTPNLFLTSAVIKIVLALIPIGFQIYVTHTSWVKISPNEAYLAVAFGFSIVVLYVMLPTLRFYLAVGGS